LAKDWLFGYRLDLVEWVVLVIVCGAVAATLVSLGFAGPGLIFVAGIPAGLGSVWVLRRFRDSEAYQPASAPVRGEGSALLSLLLFAVGSLVGLMALLVGVTSCLATKVNGETCALAFAAGVAAVGMFYAGVRLRRGGKNA
jgi:hypothetical protein